METTTTTEDRSSPLGLAPGLYVVDAGESVLSAPEGARHLEGLTAEQAFPELRDWLRFHMKWLTEVGGMLKGIHHWWDDALGTQFSRLRRREDGHFEWLFEPTQPGFHALGGNDLMQLAQRSVRDVFLLTKAEPLSLPGPRIVYVNEAVTAMTGYRPDELIGRSPRILQSAETDPDEKARIRAALTAWQPTRSELLNVRKDGRPFWVELDIVPIKNEAGWVMYWLSVQRNVTERRERAERLAHDSRMEAIGVLAGGIAHDFNNYLSAIQLLGELAAVSSSDDQLVRTLMKELSVAVRQASGLTKQLLTFSRGGTPVVATADLVDVVRETARFVTRGTRIHLAYQLPTTALAVIDPDQIAQVVSNLIINARQAQQDTGDLTVRILPVDAGLAWRIEVEDAGPGVPEADLARIFDPYFSTKPGGKGLGLAVCHSIVHRHGGTIGAYRTPEGKMVFAVTLPTGDTGAFEVVSTRPAPTSMPKAKGRVLVMDDEDEVRSTLIYCLEAMGCAVEATADGEAAFNSYERAMSSGRRFDFVFLDLTVPNGWDGLRTFEQLRRIDPDVCAAVISGYAADSTMAKTTELGFAGRLSKPFGLQDLNLLLVGMTQWVAQRGPVSGQERA